MAEYIDREAAKKEIKRFIGYLDEGLINRLIIGINKIPAADVASVRRGRWLDVEVKDLAYYKMMIASIMEIQRRWQNIAVSAGRRWMVAENEINNPKQ